MTEPMHLDFRRGPVRGSWEVWCKAAAGWATVSHRRVCLGCNTDISERFKAAE